MRPFVLGILLIFSIGFVQLQAQDKEKMNPNIWEGKVLFIDHFSLADNTEGLERGIGLGLEAGYHRHLSNLISVGIPFKVAVADIPNVGDFDDRIRLISLDLVARIRGYKPENKVVPYGFVGVGGVFESINGESNDNTYFQIPLGAGLHYRLGPWGYVSAQAEYRMTATQEFDRNNLQLGLGFTWQIGKGEPKKEEPKVMDLIADSDEDGIPDKDDECPTVAGIQAFKGCPDTDGDGIADSKDKCPDEAGSAAAMGCPDSDNDGVPDVEDKCPELAGTLMGCPDFDNDGVPNNEDECPDLAGSLNGCPDKDSDGIADKDDACPELAGVASNRGCPLATDSDGDGVIDSADACPTIAGSPSNRGCPAIKAEERQVLEYAMQAVRFETGSARLRAESYGILDQVAQVVRNNPYNNLRINGHTDNTGSTGNNLNLSERRAKACFDYLKSVGIDPLKMAYVGYGEDRPIADNDTSEGRRLNRRVEFELYIE